MVGPLDERNSGWMTTDFAAWIFLVTTMKGYRCDRTIWLPIRPIHDLFPGGFVTFGEAGCDRLQLPLPTLERSVDPEITAHSFAFQCLFSLHNMAQKVKRGQKLLLLLIGHGSYDGVFRFLITTDSTQVTNEAYLAKDELEDALEGCQGDVLVISNACHSSNLVSERWTLLCAAGPNQESNALTESSSGHFRGSIFTACVVAQAAHKYGLQVPLPRAVKRSSGDHWVPLPPTPPISLRLHPCCCPAFYH